MANPPEFHIFRYLLPNLQGLHKIPPICSRFTLRRIGTIDWQFIGPVLNGMVMQWRKLKMEYGTEGLLVP